VATVDDLVTQTRNMLQGSMTDEFSVLANPYAVTDTTITLRYPRTKIQPNMVLSCGLNTWYVLDASSDGTTFTILPSTDGSPKVAITDTATSLVRIKPRYTNWAIFQELSDAIAAVSSPANGVFGVASFEASPNYVTGYYSLPDTWTVNPIRLLRVRSKNHMTQAWQDVPSYEWIPENGAVKIFEPQPRASLLEFLFAMPFARPSALTDDLYTALGMYPEMRDIPTLGAAMMLSLGSEGRRGQLNAQGDSRRAEEVPPGGHTSMSRSFAAHRQARISEEASRLIRLYGYRGASGMSNRSGF